MNRLSFSRYYLLCSVVVLFIGGGVSLTSARGISLLPVVSDNSPGDPQNQYPEALSPEKEVLLSMHQEVELILRIPEKKLLLRDKDGTTHPITDTVISARFLTDGSIIAVRDDLSLVRFDNTLDPTLLLPTQNANGPLFVSPDGSRVAYLKPADFEGGSIPLTNGIAVYDLRIGTEVVLFSVPYASVHLYGWLGNNTLTVEIPSWDSVSMEPSPYMFLGTISATSPSQVIDSLAKLPAIQPGASYPRTSLDQRWVQYDSRNGTVIVDLQKRRFLETGDFPHEFKDYQGMERGFVEESDYSLAWKSFSITSSQTPLPGIYAPSSNASVQANEPSYQLGVFLYRPAADHIPVSAYRDLDRDEGSIRDWTGWTGTEWVFGHAYDQHNGTDYAGRNQAPWTPVFPAQDGTVGNVFIDCANTYPNTKTYGTYVEISHGVQPDGANYKTRYAHLRCESESILVRTGDVINSLSDKIADQGNTGYSTGHHLHLDVIRNGILVDPYELGIIGSAYSGNGSCSAPSLISPGDNALLSARTNTFSWSSVNGCQFSGYRFRVCTSNNVSSASNCFIDEYVTGTQRSITITGRDKTDLYWGVKAENAPQGASWAVRKFQIDPDSGGGAGSTCVNNEQPGRDEVILFDEPNFGPGACARLQIGEYTDLGEFQLDDKVSSVRVGEDVDVILFKDKNFGEPKEKIESDHVNLDVDSDVRKNEASSAKVIEEGSDGGGDDGGQGTTCTGNQAPAADEVILFDEPNFGAGPCARLKIGDYSNLGEFEMDDKASSVRVGADVDVILYKNQGFGEPSQKIENDHVNLDDNSNVKKNEASSARVRHEDDSDDGGGGQGAICASNEKPDDDEVILFDEPNFGPGPCARLKIGEYANLGQFEMNDKASSIRVGEDVDVEIFENKDFGGDHQKIENDHVNLDDDSDVRKNEASSAKVFREGSDGGGGNCSNPGPSQAAIFDGEDYGGACLILEMGQYPDFHDLPIDLNDMVSSIKTGSLVRLKLYEHQNYNGDRSGRMSEFGAGTSDPDLTDNAIKKNAASSAKVYFVLGTPTVYPIENNDGDGGFPITWSSVQHAEMYDIYEQFNSGGWNAIADDFVGLSLDRSGLAPGTWCYKVRAANFGHSGPESNTVCTTVVPPPEPPETPQLLDIDNSDEDGQFMVQWEQAANTETYELQENWNSGSWGIAYVGPDRFAGRIDRGSGEWCYRTKAHGPGGSSEWSATKCATVAESISPPEVPTVNPIDNTDMDGAYTVSWTAVSGADLYQLEEQHDLQGWSLAYEGALTAFDASGRGPGDWCYRVKAQGPGGASDWSPVVCTSVETDVEEPPDAPSLNAIDNPGNTGSFIISWVAAANSEAFALQRNHNGGNWLSIYSGALTSVQQSNLAEGSWCYRVQAVKGGLSSTWSNTVCTFVAGSAIDVETLFLPLVQR